MKNWNPLLILFALILLALTAWFAGRIDGKPKEDTKSQKAIDSLTLELTSSTARYEKLNDSLESFKDKAFERIDIINEVKKTIKNEIRNQNKTIRAIPDSLVQRYVDSIRSNGGFY